MKRMQSPVRGTADHQVSTLDLGAGGDSVVLHSFVSF